MISCPSPSSSHVNIRKQVVKAAKIHFLDSGLVCFLVGIREPEQLRLHPLRGAIFESRVVSEIYKSFAHQGLRPRLYHCRESRGAEIDLIVERDGGLDAAEVKSGATVSRDFFNNLKIFSNRMGRDGRARSVRSLVVYGGNESQKRTAAQVLSWQDLDPLVEGL